MFWKEHVDIFNDTLTGYFVYFQNVIADEYFLNRDVDVNEAWKCIKKM